MASKTVKGEKYKHAPTSEELAKSWRIMNVEQHSGMGQKMFSDHDFKRRMQF